MSTPPSPVDSEEVRVGSVVRFTSDALERFRAALTRRGIPDALQTAVFDALVETAPSEASTSTLTEAERAFALSAGIPESAFTLEAAAANRLYEMRSAATDSTNLREGVLSTAQVAERFGTTPDSVRQQAQRGTLYSVGLMGGQKAFPRWQFTDAGPLPGLREVIAAMPNEYHPLDVEAVMSEADESLGHRSPRDWLAAGGPTGPVVRLMSDLSYT